MNSFVVPAHNEEACLPATLQAIHESAAATGQPYEIIVVNDASTDRTAEIALAHDARIIDVDHRQIAATRNSGARAAHGEHIFFIDADTIINPAAVTASLRALDHGAIGGGALVKVEGPVPLFIRLIEIVGYLPCKLVGFCGGAFMFCAREAFHATGGFNEKLYWGEEGLFGLALKRFGRFEVVWPRVLTSGRRFRTTSGLEVIRICARAVFRPIKTFTQRASVQKIWYDSNRANDDKMPNTLGVKISNAIALLLTLSFITAPILQFIPWTLTPLNTAIGKARFINAIFLNHIGLLLWPVIAILLLTLLRQKFTREFLKTISIIALCAWQAQGATAGVIFIWTRFYYSTFG